MPSRLCWSHRHTRTGKPWRIGGVLKILKNYNYTGNLLLQKTYSENHLTKRKLVNNGEQPQYHVEGAHEAIIDLDTFEAVQEEIERRAEYYAPTKKATSYPLRDSSYAVSAESTTGARPRQAVSFGSAPPTTPTAKKPVPPRRYPKAFFMT